MLLADALQHHHFLLPTRRGEGEVWRLRGRNQFLGIGVARLSEHALGAAFLHDVAVAHDQHPRAHALDDVEIVGDKKQGRSALFGHALNDAEDPVLRGGIEGCGGLVADKNVGASRHGHG